MDIPFPKICSSVPGNVCDKPEDSPGMLRNMLIFSSRKTELAIGHGFIARILLCISRAGLSQEMGDISLVNRGAQETSVSS
jgi:hypothetical protein